MIRKNQVAPKVATGLASSTVTFTVESGQPIWVYGIIISRDVSLTLSNASIKTGDGTATLLTVRHGTVTLIFDIPFKADKGLSFNMDTTTTKRITVFYSGSGM